MNNQMVIVDGVVLENLPNTSFRVQVNNSSLPDLAGKTILCHMAGKMRLNYVKLLPGDKVRCEVNTLDLSRGRIVYKNR
jgi:translation initiation factor IF-1